MLAWFLITCLSVGHLWPSLGWSAQTSNSGAASERRLFSVRSHQAWEVVRKRLNELGLSPDKTDGASQAVLTKWREVGAKGVEWLPAATLPEPYVAKRIRFLVFVSPFAEPARVSIGSLIEATDRSTSASRAVVYNGSDVNRTLMREIAKALGEDGLPIPTDREERRKISLSVLKDAADDCLRRGAPPKGAKVTAPRKIPVSVFEVLYPAQALAASTEGTVRVEFVILEDGTVSDIRVLDRSLGRQLEASAIGAVSLLLYSPAKLNECAVPTIMTYSVHYRVH